MQLKHFRALKIVSIIVLFFFSWTFGGLFDIAYAIKDSSESRVAGHPVKLRHGPPKGRDFRFASTGGLKNQKAEKPEEKFSKALEDITDIVQSVQAVQTVQEKKAKKKKLKAKKIEIEDHDRELKKKFKETEQKLIDAGLPPEILKRHHDFVKKYEDNLLELKTNLDDIEKAETKENEDREIEKAKKHLKKVKPPKKHIPLDPNKLPHRTPDVKKRKPRLKKKDFLGADRASRISHNESPILVASAGSLDGLLNGSEFMVDSSLIDVHSSLFTVDNSLIPNSQIRIFLWLKPQTSPPLLI